MNQLDVLIIDDDEQVGELLSRAFVPKGISVCVATTGEQAVKSAEGVRFRMILCDYNMPGLSGSALLGRLQTLNPEARIFVMSGSGIETLPEMELRQAGMEEFILKPFVPADLLPLVREVLGS